GRRGGDPPAQAEHRGEAKDGGGKLLHAFSPLPGKAMVAPGLRRLCGIGYNFTPLAWGSNPNLSGETARYSKQGRGTGLPCPAFAIAPCLQKPKAPKIA